MCARVDQHCFAKSGYAYRALADASIMCARLHVVQEKPSPWLRGSTIPSQIRLTDLFVLMFEFSMAHTAPPTHLQEITSQYRHCPRCINTAGSMAPSCTLMTCKFMQMNKGASRCIPAILIQEAVPNHFLVEIGNPPKLCK